MSKFRSIAGCCVGMAPVALEIIGNRAVEYGDGRVLINTPVDKETEEATVRMNYPDTGYISIKPKQTCDVAVRVYSWMEQCIEGRINGRACRRRRGTNRG